MLRQKCRTAVGEEREDCTRADRIKRQQSTEKVKQFTRKNLPFKASFKVTDGMNGTSQNSSQNGDF